MEDERIREVYIAVKLAAEHGGFGRGFESLAVQFGGGFGVKQREVREVMAMGFREVLAAVSRTETQMDPKYIGAARRKAMEHGGYSFCPICDGLISPPRGEVSQMAEHFAREHPGHSTPIPPGSADDQAQGAQKDQPNRQS